MTICLARYLDRLPGCCYGQPTMTTQTASTTHTADARKIEAARKRAIRREMQAHMDAHNALAAVLKAEQAAAAAKLATHVAQWGEDGFECA